MTRIWNTVNGKKRVLAAEGHAGYAKDGQPDRVCAAASMLVCTAARRMEQLKKDGAVEQMVFWQKSGDARLEVTVSSFGHQLVREAMTTVMAGFRMLEEEYPEYVRVMH